MTLVNQLQKTKLLHQLSEDHIRRYILPAGHLSEYARGDYILRAQEKADDVPILLTGKVNILHYFADGSYSLAGTETPLKVLALDLIATRTRIAPYYARAAEPSTLFSFPADLIFQPGDLPETDRFLLMKQLLLMISHLHMQKEYHLAILSRKGLRDRIIVYLSMQATRTGSSTFTIPFSRDEMAAFLSVNRSALSHELSLMKQEGLLDFSKNRFTLLQHDFLDGNF